jgi:cytochrome c553
MFRCCFVIAVIFSVPVQASERVDQLVLDALQLEPNARAGARIYQDQCVTCHGRNALGDAKKVVPMLAGQRQAYLVKQLADFFAGERSATSMHAVVKRVGIDEPQTWMDVAAYLNGLRSSGQASAASKATALGKQLYEQQCLECHGPDGRGDEDGFVPSLRHQLPAYLIREMSAFAASHRANADQDFMQFLDRLDPPAMEALAMYLAQIRGPVRDLTRLRNDGHGGD